MNEYIQYIPKMLSGEELDEKLRVMPRYDETVRYGSMTERLIALQSIYKIYVPNRIGREVYAKIYLALLRSLEKKQSLQAVRQSNENSRIVRQQTYESIIGGADSFTIIGTSGIGKSSAVSRAVRIITDDAYIEMNNSKVIPCLTVQAPADGSIKGLLLEILRKVDEVLDTRYQMNAIRSKATVDILIGSVSQVSLNHIGILIVDEIQNVAQSKNGKMIVGTLIQLINNSGVSICMVGTPEAAVFFDQAMMLARRSLGLRYELIEYGDAYCDFCRTLLAYNYTKADVEVNEGCYTDDFYTGLDDSLKKQAMFAEFNAFFERYTFNIREVFEDVLTRTRVEMPDGEKKQFYDKHLKSLQLETDKEGNVRIELKR